MSLRSNPSTTFTHRELTCTPGGMNISLTTSFWQRRSGSAVAETDEPGEELTQFGDEERLPTTGEHIRPKLTATASSCLGPPRRSVTPLRRQSPDAIQTSGQYRTLLYTPLVRFCPLKSNIVLTRAGARAISRFSDEKWLRTILWIHGFTPPCDLEGCGGLDAQT